MAEQLTMKKLQSQIDELRGIIERLSDRIVKEPNKIKIDNNKFDLCGYEWKVIKKDDNGNLMCICESIGDMKFDSDSTMNDWSKSDLREYLNGEFKKMIIDEIGVDSIKQFSRRLFSIDGSRDYGVCDDYVSLLTSDEYRELNKEIGTNDEYWWLCNANGKYVTVVCSSGYFIRRYCDYFSGVRPVCIFCSSIFESEE